MKQIVTHQKPHARVYAPAQINVLIACEESQRECLAFRALGFNAFSCDVQPPHGGHPEYHINGDVTPLLQGETSFTTSDGVTHTVDHWHLVIAHPPCTYLCKVGSPFMRPNGQLNQARYAKMLEARQFFFVCLNAQSDYLAVENPLPMAIAQLPCPTTYIQPSWYGVKYTKKTLLWLRNLPPLLPTVTHPFPKCFVSCSRGKYRSRTFPEVAKAMAEQWGRFILDDLNYSGH